MSEHDAHSYADPLRVRVTHLSLALSASFERQTLRGKAKLTVERLDPAAPLVLDSRDLQIEAVVCTGQAVPFELAHSDPILGSKLSIALPAGVESVEVDYSTSPQARACSGSTPNRRPARNSHFSSAKASPSTRAVGFRCRIRQASASHTTPLSKRRPA